MTNELLGPKGHVIITNKSTGEILVDKDNMIVSDGRKIAAAKFLSNMSEDIEGLSELGLGVYINYKISEIYLSSKTDETFFTMTESIKDTSGDIPILVERNSTKLNVEKMPNGTGCGIDGHGHVYIKFSVTYSPNSADNKNISSLYIIAKNSSSAEEKLFSRIRFDTIILRADSSYQIDYYIYF